jgi:hypothetical protein
MYEAKNVATLCFSNNQIMKIMSQGINNLDCYLLQQKMHMSCRPSITDSLLLGAQFKCCAWCNSLTALSGILAEERLQ